ncbi:uncharacterized protein G6M90_00g039260 [Metarhizium brunneum]|uniref:Uncharacterized protein n=1 Tax=Metarhizium brunneum TaxID=500148 RepID=A0A7D5UU62_9HYPO|nr:hypothetical protein G6M90_00g039260 [Metarhizium brunneum]
MERKSYVTITITITITIVTSPTDVLKEKSKIQLRRQNGRQREMNP